MSTTTITAPSSKRAAPEKPVSRKRVGEPSIYARYVGAMLYFVGAALIAGAVVHYPIDPPVYAVICIVGALVFLLGTIVNEFVFAAVRPTLRRAVALVTFSLLLSFGVGLLGGGIQHFEQFPERSAAMTPIGMLMSYAAFVAKDPDGRWRHVFSLFGASFLLVTALTWVGMSALATTMETPAHDHGTTQTPADQVPADEAPAKQNNTPVDDEDAPAEHEDGTHAH